MYHRFQRLLDGLRQGIWERDQALALGLLALIAGESLFLLGPPGVAKSLVARRLKAALHQAKAFEYLMGRFSTPEEIFGPLSIAGLRDRDVFERQTGGYLPEADVAFLDEIWRSSPPIQNSLLTILNEKVFRNGGKELRVPLKLLVAASNGLPDGEENAQAFWDRFILRLEVGPVTSAEAFRGLLEGHTDLAITLAADDTLTAEEWALNTGRIDGIGLPEEVLAALETLRTRLADGPYVSDRRWKKAVRILKASALVHDRASVDSLDLGLLEHMLWQRSQERPEIVKLVQQVLGETGWPSPYSVDDFGVRVDQLRAELRALTLKERTTTRPKPVLADGEYYQLIGYPGTLSARVWAQDFALLKQDEDLDGELFFFTPYGPFQKSEPHLLRATGGPAEIEVDGRLFALESQPEQVVFWDQVLPDGPSLRAWEQRGNALAQELLAARTALETLAQSRELEASKHLFCGGPDQPWAAACRHGLDADALDLGDLLVDVETLLETRLPGDSR